MSMKKIRIHLILPLSCLFWVQFARALELSGSRDMKLVARVLEQSHRIYSEGWKVLLSSSSSPASPMKMVADHLTKNLKKKKLDVPELLVWNQRTRLMKFEFQPDQFRKAFGDSLAILNRKASCEFLYEENKKIQKMKCTGLGTNLSKTVHIEFHEISYDFKSNQILEIKADQYENLLKKQQCSSPDPCLHMKVPFDGKIHILENRIKEKEPELQPPPPENVKIENQPQTQEPSEVPDEKNQDRKKRSEVPAEGDAEPGL